MLPAKAMRLPLHRQGDAELSMMCDALSAMLGRESAYSICDYLYADPKERGRGLGESPASENDGDGTGVVTIHHPPCTITADDRAKLVDWCYAIVDRCQLQREMVAVAMNIVDRFMSVAHSPSVYLCDRDEYQLLTLASLYVAIKVAERNLLSSEAMSAISQGMYSVGEIEAVELEILSVLGWRISPPTPVAVGRQILGILKRATSSQVEQAAFALLRHELEYQTELAVREYHFSTERPWTVAMASLLNAVERVGDNLDRETLMRGLLRVMMDFWRQYSFDYPRMLVEARGRLAALVNENDEDDAMAAPDEATALAMAE